MFLSGMTSFLQNVQYFNRYRPRGHSGFGIGALCIDHSPTTKRRRLIRETMGWSRSAPSPFRAVVSISVILHSVLTIVTSLAPMVRLVSGSPMDVPLVAMLATAAHEVRSPASTAT